VKAPLFGGNRRLLFRSYLLLVAALLAVAFGLQLAFDALLSADKTQNHPWLRSTLSIVAAELEAAAPADRERVAADLSFTLGMSVQLLQRDEIAAPADVELEALVNEAGETFYLYAPPALDELVYVGPVPVADESWLVRAGPPLFYFSIVVLVGLWLRPILRDINRMTSAAQRFAADYRTPLNTADATTELTTLAQNLDDMSLRLSSLIQNQKELIAALSHEMRTPLARIRFALALIGNEASDDARKQLALINDDVQEIDDLIATMLNYARLDHPDLQMDWRQVPLEPWLEQAADKYHGPGKRLVIEREPGFDAAMMDARLMALATSNLLSNAERHADSTFRLRMGRRGDGFELSVEDDGKGVPEAARDSVFKAFTRLDDSRSRETGGYGLGLAIVARIAALHGGDAGGRRASPVRPARQGGRAGVPLLHIEGLGDLDRAVALQVRAALRFGQRVVEVRGLDQAVAARRVRAAVAGNRAARVHGARFAHRVAAVDHRAAHRAQPVAPGVHDLGRFLLALRGAAAVIDKQVFRHGFLSFSYAFRE
jgi:two-component system OmpR family sensor kinase